MRQIFVAISILFLLLPDLASSKNFLHLHAENGVYLMDVPKTTLNRDILVTITILQGAARENRARDMRFGYGGDAVFDQMIRFTKDGNKLQIEKPSVVSDNTAKSIYAKLNQSAMNPIVAAFPIKKENDSTYTIDMTSFLKQDNPLVSLSGAKEELKLGEYEDAKSYIENVVCYSENMNIRSYRAYKSRNEKEDPNATNWMVGTSWFLLPKTPMMPQLADRRVGYFTTPVAGAVFRDDYLLQEVRYANRWRLEPKPEDLAKYQQGELVEPQKQIVFYIDRATPAYLVPYFIEAVKAWNPVFEKAGFKHAITAKLAPTQEEDSTYSEEDIRYSLISYKASPIPNAYGPMVVDPRSGEILNSHIGVFHSVQELIQRWYFVMCAAVEPNARQYPLAPEVMGDLVSNVVTHEVGHTLGLLHDFVGSTLYSVDSLRNVDFVRKNGIGASIMDYERFNYVAQPGDGFKGKDMMNRIGRYDDFAIEWGYRFHPGVEDPVAVAKTLKNWVDKKRAEDPAVFFLPENDLSDPRVQSEDCGSDQIAANTLCVKNLKLLMANLEKWNPANDEGNYVLRRRYMAILSHYENCMKHALKFIGGRYTNNPSREEKDQTVYTQVPAEMQMRAVDFLCENVFSEPKWLFDESIMKKVNADFENYIRLPYSSLMGKLLGRCGQLEQNSRFKDGKDIGQEIYDRLEKELFTSKKPSTPLTKYQRMLQGTFVSQLSILAENQANFLNGNSASARETLLSIKKHIQAVRKQSLTNIDRQHYLALENFISIWETKKQKQLLEGNKN